ncbi:MAG: 4-hydroxythreonine-4-phosphate dehydrogenase PdxA, partial [Anaerolineae bacterium]|nr:4-hydroxythreonine-4-phosphate dehydrogenase PdxA [Anaerolineae bacterium]
MNRLPIVGITIGDAAGIGPEVVVKAIQQQKIYRLCRPLVIGDARVFNDPKFAAQFPEFQVLTDIEHAEVKQDKAFLLDMHNLDPASVTVGQVCTAAGKAAVEYILKATELAMSGKIHAIATAPINKEAIRLAGYKHIGHTEILTEATQSSRCTTMLATPGLRVTHVTRHIPLREVADQITKESVLETIIITDAGMRSLGYPNPRLAVAGLNPHNGEGGLLGREEIDEIAPAVLAAQAAGINVHGPIPADSVFFQTIRGDYDVVVTLYHDQGHIAVKVHGFEKSITITLGLPLIRTSADHGTAFNIAGQGVAMEDSMVAAISEAAQIARQTPPGRGLKASV